MKQLPIDLDIYLYHSFDILIYISNIYIQILFPGTAYLVETIILEKQTGAYESVG